MSRTEIPPNVPTLIPRKLRAYPLGPHYQHHLYLSAHLPVGIPPPSPITLVPPSSGPQHQSPVPAQSSKSRSPSPQPPARSLGQHFPQGAFPTLYPTEGFRQMGKWPDNWREACSNGKGYPSPNSTSPLPTRPGVAFGQITLPGLSMARTSGADKLEDRTASHLPCHEGTTSGEATGEDSGERKSSADKPQPRRPPVPHKPSRIPSTGNRATVMDVAQVWSQHEKQGSQDVASPRSASPIARFESHPVQPVGPRPDLINRGNWRMRGNA
jgi:hypothetical protein